MMLSITEPSFDLSGYHTITLVAQKGWGKTVAMCMLASELQRCIFVDTLGVAEGLIPASYYIKDITPTNFEALKGVLKETKQPKVVLDMRKINEVAIASPYLPLRVIGVVAEIATQLQVPVLIDEVKDYAPQRGKVSEGLVKLATNGRNYGVSPFIMATQRPQIVSKDVLELSDVYIIGALRGKNNKEWISSLFPCDTAKQFMGFWREITSFKPRECYIISDKEPVRATIKRWRWA